MILPIPCALIALAFAQTSARDLYLEDTPAGAAEAPLGARIQIRKEQQGRWRVMEPNTIFRSGDKVRIEVESKSAAHLYVVSRGSDGSWSVLFPEGNLRTGSRVRSRQMVSISAEFDNKPGQETVYVVLMRQPVVDRQELLKNLPSGAVSTSRDLLLETAPASEGQAIFAVSPGGPVVTQLLLRHQ